jgi:hypothetical protein
MNDVEAVRDGQRPRQASDAERKIFRHSLKDFPPHLVDTLCKRMNRLNHGTPEPRIGRMHLWSAADGNDGRISPASKTRSPASTYFHVWTDPRTDGKRATMNQPNLSLTRKLRPCRDSAALKPSEENA